VTHEIEPDRLLKLNEVKRRVGLEKSMIYRLIQTGKFPEPYKVASCASRWSEHEISSWLHDIKARSGAAAQRKGGCLEGQQAAPHSAPPRQKSR
jgi:prophage regulatory protein